MFLSFVIMLIICWANANRCWFTMLICWLRSELFSCLIDMQHLDLVRRIYVCSAQLCSTVMCHVGYVWKRGNRKRNYGRGAGWDGGTIWWWPGCDLLQLLCCNITQLSYYYTLYSDINTTHYLLTSLETCC